MPIKILRSALEAVSMHMCTADNVVEAHISAIYR